ncbi:hypothetical protein GCM10009785_10480 [Brooklawnia cerclae]|uniref:Double-glycine peptidase n=1 Tax=Brooklawnia cerclae TaxID=349934 RepID=A0ABX0SKB4_9ACTN|nr:putative double-glycine peptidase [Brooklawnia cerclae]
MPDVRQSTDYTCGVASLQAVLFYYGLEYREGTLASYAESDPDLGTSPEGIEKAVMKVNNEKNTSLSVEVKNNETLTDLESHIDQTEPVIVDIQAWRDATNTAQWEDDADDGHYVVAIGYDNENIYFEDPALLASIGRIPRDEFVSRWHDASASSEYNHLAIIVTGGTSSSPSPIVSLQ